MVKKPSFLSGFDKNHWVDTAKGLFAEARDAANAAKDTVLKGEGALPKSGFKPDLNALLSSLQTMGGMGETLEGLNHAYSTAKIWASGQLEQILGQDFELRLQMLALSQAQLGAEPFGTDFSTVKKGASFAALLHRKYFRTKVYGIEKLPEGPILLVSNHSGQIPLDAMMIASSLLFDGNPPRLCRALYDRWVTQLPLVEEFYQGCGQVLGSRENCEALLERGDVVLTFPEGMRGITKPIQKRYQLSEFGTGFVRMARKHGVPVVPVAVVGAEEQYINLGNLEKLAKALGLPALPLIPQMLIPGGQLPLPTRYHIEFGEPVLLEGDPDDELGIQEDAVGLRSSVSELIERRLKERDGIFR